LLSEPPADCLYSGLGESLRRGPGPHGLDEVRPGA